MIHCGSWALGLPFISNIFQSSCHKSQSALTFSFVVLQRTSCELAILDLSVYDPTKHVDFVMMIPREPISAFIKQQNTARMFCFCNKSSLLSSDYKSLTFGKEHGQ